MRWRRRRRRLPRRRSRGPARPRPVSSRPTRRQGRRRLDAELPHPARRLGRAAIARALLRSDALAAVAAEPHQRRVRCGWSWRRLRPTVQPHGRPASRGAVRRPHHWRMRGSRWAVSLRRRVAPRAWSRAAASTSRARPRPGSSRSDPRRTIGARGRRDWPGVRRSLRTARCEQSTWCSAAGAEQVLVEVDDRRRSRPSTPCGRTTSERRAPPRPCVPASTSGGRRRRHSSTTRTAGGPSAGGCAERASSAWSRRRAAGGCAQRFRIT